MKNNIVVFSLLILFSGCAWGEDSGEQYKVVYSLEEGVVEETNTNIKKEITIAIVPKLINIPYFNAVQKGAMEAGNDLGVRVIYTGPSLADADQQIKIIKELIEEKVDVIAVSANNPEKLSPVLLEAKEKGIKVITWDADTLPDSREFFVNMVDPETLGRHLMDILAWNTNEEGQFAIMTGSLSAANLNEWLHWILVQHEEYYPNMTLVEIMETDQDSQKAYSRAVELIEKYPNLKGIIGNSSESPPAAASAVKKFNKHGEIAVVGLSSPNEMNEYLKDGSAQIVTLWSPKKLGYLTVALAKNAYEGFPPYDRQQIPQVGQIRMIEDMVIMGEPIDFTEANVDQYDF
ncbi:autoinducer 2 ABC transporter substrate-binding protein [Evansella sp. AB-rgal1]|uniref:autoinducer 2 ABC transporter substrate-binding protein n=1 Tax=Evansella sp. AB-rgal1 TaxID=3242696 RepID=UPI00359CCA51